MSKVHNFQESLVIGNEGEKKLTDYLTSLGYEVRKLTVPEQLEKLYDLECTKETVNGKVSVQIEVKTERKAERTGNIFFETSVGTLPGWCLKYPEDSKVFVTWYLPMSEVIYTLPARKLKLLDYKKYPFREVLNETYIATGYLIPLTYLRKVCKVTYIGK